ncbi:1137_t:CDS:2 [Dentiscutata erythropus]|uniref:1137_t:CDS:1 n=1 Tax=Dentiscutata erythropus TaxID=1348616 RepID=A0A9N9B9H3_9GLOM|nr:1137_t:CDS:2 [Dentiscutata erythropus]
MAGLKNAIFMFLLAVCFSSVIAEVNITTPQSPVPNGYEMTITWQISGQLSTQPGNLTIVNLVTGNVKVIDNRLNVASLSKVWNVTVVPGSYVLSINDSVNISFSGSFTVSQGIYYPPTNTPTPQVSKPTVTLIVSSPTNSQVPATITVVPTSDKNSSPVIIIAVVVGSVVGVVIIICVTIWVFLRYFKNKKEVIEIAGSDARRSEIEETIMGTKEYGMTY